jgi:hypothetical protein
VPSSSVVYSGFYSSRRKEVEKSREEEERKEIGENWKGVMFGVH